jgi:hemerythrin-like domain-containing protein
MAFARLAVRQPELQLSLERLRQEHRVIAQAGDQLAGQLEAVMNGALVPRAHIEAAAATYLVYYGSHIAREEQDVLLRAAAVLTSADWQAVAVAGPASLQQ